MKKLLAFFLFALAFASAAFGQSVTTNQSATGMPAATAAYSVSVTATRPANTTTYTANDVIGGSPTAVLTFSNIGLSGANVSIRSADLRIDAASVPAGMANMRLYLYSATPPSALADNAAWDIQSGDRSAYIGYIDLGTPVDLGSTLFVQADQINKQIKLAAGSTTVYGYLVTIGGFTPGAISEVYTITLRVVVL